MPCCQGTNANGEWYFPNDYGQIPIMSTATSFYRNREDSGEVNLFRLNSDVMEPTGEFCCVVPDATGLVQTVCANIGELHKYIVLQKCKLAYLYACTPQGFIYGGEGGRGEASPPKQPILMAPDCTLYSTRVWTN